MEDFYNGKKKTFKLPRRDTCSTCTGNGTKEGTKPTKCTVCKGRGTVIQTQQFGPGMVQQVQTTCYKCSGKGEIIKEQDKCGTCRGTKIQVKDHFFSFEIEKGSKPFQKNVPAGKLFTAEFVAKQLFTLTFNNPHLELNGEPAYLDWQGETIPW